MRKSRSTRAIATAVAAVLVGGVFLGAVPAQAEKRTGSGSKARRPSAIRTRGQGFDYRDIKPQLSKKKFSDNQVERVVFTPTPEEGEKLGPKMSAPEDLPPYSGMDIRLHVEVVKPKAKGNYPVILELSPYHGTIADRNGARIFPGPKDSTLPPWIDAEAYGTNDKELGLAGYFAPRGYAVAFVNLRGTGRSQGCLDHMGAQDQSDAKDLIKWLADKPWSNGRVGMVGHSYVGSTPSMAAAQNPPALKTIVPSAGLGAMYHHKFQQGVPYFLQWIGPAEAYEELALDRHLPGILGEAYGDSFGDGTEFFGCGLTQSAVMSEEDFDAGVYDDEEPFPWDLERDWRRKAAKADIPVFLVHGVNDNAARIPAIDWFRWRRGDIDNRDKAWIGQWDHGSNTYPNDRTCPQHVPTPCDNDQWTLALHAWFDKHLKRKDVPTGPKVEVFLNNRTVYQPTEWPPRRENRWRRFFFHPDGKLVRGKKPEDVTSASFVGNPDGEVLEYTEETPNSLAWTSKPFKEKALLASVPTLRLFESQTVSRMHIITTLYDINKQGEVTCVLVRPKTSADAERCGISKASFAMQPELRDGVREQVPVVPGDPMKLNMVGMDQAWVIKPGHRIRIVVATSQPDKVATHSEGTVTVYMGGNQASRVALPIIYNARLRKDTFHN